MTEVLTLLGTALLFLLCALLGSLWRFTLAWGPQALRDASLRSPAGAGRFVAGTVARVQNATALFMNVVEGEFSEVPPQK